MVRWLEYVARRQHGPGRLLRRLWFVLHSWRAPFIRPLANFLAAERWARGVVWGNLVRALYRDPVFRSRCKSVGDPLYLFGTIPVVSGDGDLSIGDGVKLDGPLTFVVGMGLEHASITIGDHTYVGPGTTISAAQGIVIGKHVLISGNVYIADNDGHSLDAQARRDGTPMAPDGVKPVAIEDDCWIGTRVIILKGVHIGAGAIVGAGAVVTTDVPPRVVVAGNPARVVKELESTLART